MCANVPGQFAVPAALSGLDTIGPLVAPGGPLYETRRAVAEACAASPHLKLRVPDGTLYAFPRVAGAAQGSALELVEREHVLLVPGSSFNVPCSDHPRHPAARARAVARSLPPHRPRPRMQRRTVNKTAPLTRSTKQAG